MKKYFLVSLIGLLLVTTGCVTRLSVRVEILDRDRFKQLPAVIEAKVETIENRVRQNRIEGRYEKIQKELKDNVKTVFDTLAQRDPRKTGSPDPMIIPEMIKNINSAVDKSFNEAKQRYDKALIKIDSAQVIELDTKNRHRLLSEAKLFFTLGDTILSRLGAALEKELRKETHQKGVSEQKMQRLFEITGFNQTQNALTSLTQDAGLLHDPLSSSVISASNSLWKGKFNDTYARGIFGNSDIAVVMESLGHYTIKGLRLDASKAIEFSRKTFLHSIQFMAATQGYSTSAVPDDSSFEISELVTLKKNESEAEIRRQSFQTAAKALLETIIAQKENLKNNRLPSETFKIIKAAFEAYKPKFNPTLNGGNQ